MSNIDALHYKEQLEALIHTLKLRFEQSEKRQANINWDALEQRLRQQKDKLTTLFKMEQTGGEPAVVEYDASTDIYTFIDCAAETPAGRRSYCYDKVALDKRKQNKPENNAVDVATDIGIQLMNEQDYTYFQQYGPFDQKTSSWLETPESVRSLGGALFGDYRYGRVFFYHNGADSYYGARGFRGILKV